MPTRKTKYWENKKRLIESIVLRVAHNELVFTSKRSKLRTFLGIAAGRRE